jgi:hypothetical protein
VKVGFITHLSGKVSLNTSAPTAEVPAKTDCRVGYPHYAQTRPAAIPCSFFVPTMCQEQIENPAEQKKTAALCGAAVELMG